MTVKTLADMTVPELEHELAAARNQYAAADHIEGLLAWRQARDAADARVRAAEAELVGRKSTESAKHGSGRKLTAADVKVDDLPKLTTVIKDAIAAHPFRHPQYMAEAIVQAILQSQPSVGEVDGT